MKNLFLFICLLPILAEAQTINYSLDLTIKGYSKKAKLTVSIGKIEYTNSCIAAGGRFKFNGNTNGIVEGQEIIDAQIELLEQDTDGVYRTFANPCPIILCSGKITATAKIVVDNTGVPTLKMVAIKDDLGINIEDLNFGRFCDRIKIDAFKKLDDIEEKYRTSSSKNTKTGLAEKNHQILLLGNHAEEEISLYKINTIRTHPNSLFSALLISRDLITLVNVSVPGVTAISTKSIAKTQESIKLLSPALQKSKMVETLYKQIDLYNSLLVGGTPPELIVYDSSGNEIKVSSYRGKYVYVYFTSSRCTPCRAHLNGLMVAYNKYHPGNKFEMIAYCYEQDRKDFMDYIRSLRYPWKFCSDTIGRNNASLPWLCPNKSSGFLLDPTGKIIARDIYDDELMAKLKEVIGD